MRYDMKKFSFTTSSIHAVDYDRFVFIVLFSKIKREKLAGLTEGCLELAYIASWLQYVIVVT